jgi:hypothetical protein
MADAAASKAVEGNLMRVQLPLSAQNLIVQLSTERGLQLEALFSVY